MPWAVGRTKDPEKIPKGKKGSTSIGLFPLFFSLFGALYLIITWQATEL